MCSICVESGKSGFKVVEGHRFVLPNKIASAIVCVGFSDLEAQAYPEKLCKYKSKGSHRSKNNGIL